MSAVTFSDASRGRSLVMTRGIKMASAAATRRARRIRAQGHASLNGLWGGHHAPRRRQRGTAALLRCSLQSPGGLMAGLRPTTAAAVADRPDTDWRSCSSYQVAPPPPQSPARAGTSAAVITNLIRAQVRLMRKTEASSALLINSCPIMAPGRRRRAHNEAFSPPLPLPFVPSPCCCLAQPPDNEQPSGSQLLPRLH